MYPVESGGDPGCDLIQVEVPLLMSGGDPGCGLTQVEVTLLMSADGCSLLCWRRPLGGTVGRTRLHPSGVGVGRGLPRNGTASATEVAFCPGSETPPAV